MSDVPYVRLPVEFPARYAHGPASFPQAGVPRGALHEYEWNASRRAPVVFDNLIHRGEMPVTIGVFVAPGEPGNRSVEYDAFSDAYATFLLTEILPAVQARYAITDDPDRWATGGGSSGGNCAFTRYPKLIRETPRKPRRIFLHTVTRDLNWNAPRHNWLSENLRVAAALAERDYDFRLVVGEGAHNGNHDP